MAHLILFADANFRGAHKHVFDRADILKLLGTLSNGQIVCIADCDFPDSVSSIAILEGNWRFFQGPNQASPFPVVLGPGLYPDVNAVKLVNDNIRSMIAVDEPPTVPGIPLNNHVIFLRTQISTATICTCSQNFRTWGTLISMTKLFLSSSSQVLGPSTATRCTTAAIRRSLSFS